MYERNYLPGEDDAAVLNLRSKVWGSDHPHTDTAFFKWLFQDNPDGLGSGVVSIHDDVIIGFAGIIRRKAQAGDQTLLVCHGLEFMVDPDSMRKLSRVPFRVIGAHTQRIIDLGADFAINYPNDTSVRMLTSKHIGYQKIFEPQLLVRLLSGFRFSKSDDDGFPGQALKTSAARLASIYSSVISWRRDGDVSIEELEYFDDRFDEFNTRIASDGKLRLNRDSRNLNWRYSQHPIYRYKTLAATRNGQLVGYIVVSPRQVFNTDAGLICELCVAGDDPATAVSLVNAASEDARKHKISILVNQQPSGSLHANALLRCGFIKIPARFNPKQFRMVASDITERGRIALDPDAWAFSWGDMDVV